MNNKWRGGALAVWLLLIAACSYQIIKTPVVTDLSQFLSRASAQNESFTELQQGLSARLILLAISGSDGATRAALSKYLRFELGKTPGITHVANGQLDTISTDDVSQLVRYRYLLTPRKNKEQFTASNLRDALKEQLRLLTSPFGMDRAWMAKDPTGEVKLILSRLRSAHDPNMHFGVWSTADHTRALLLVETKAHGLDVDAQEHIVSALKKAFTKAKQKVNDSADAQLEMSGPGVFAVKSRAQIRHEAQVLSVLASIAVMVLLLAAYRSSRVLLLAVLPLVTAVLFSIAIVGLTFGHIHGITLAFGATLLGIAIDYPVHLLSHLRSSTTVTQSLSSIWPTLRLSVLTSILGYLAMATTDFVGLMQLGIFAIAGLLAAVAFTRWVLPALLPPYWAPLPTVPAFPGRVLQILPAAPGAKWVIYTVGFVFLGLLLTVAPLQWEDDVAALSPVPSADRQHDQYLRSQLGAPEPSHIILIRANNIEALLQQSEQISIHLDEAVAEGRLTAFDAPHLYLPSAATQTRRKQKLPTRIELSNALDQALQGLPFKREAFARFVDAVVESRSLPTLKLGDVEGSVIGIRLNSLLTHDEGSWRSLILLTGVHDPHAFDTWFKSLPGNSAKYVNIKKNTDELMGDYLMEAVSRLWLGGGAILLLLIVALRSNLRLLRVLGPVAIAIVIDLFALAILEQRLTLFHLVSLLLVAGIGLDYSLFFSREEKDPEVQSRTLHAILVCAGSTITVFTLLVTSDLPVLRAIGSTVAIGVSACLICASLLSRPGYPLALSPAGRTKKHLN